MLKEENMTQRRELAIERKTGSINHCKLAPSIIGKKTRLQEEIRQMKKDMSPTRGDK